MHLKLDSNNKNDYLVSSSIIDYDHESIKKLAEHINREKLSEIELIKATFEYVRDNISHSADINGDVVTCNASDVLKHKEGICYVKSHLLAALLRYHGIPTGFCYQKLILCEKTARYLILHGLNGVYISSLNKWIRLDARGNKEGVNAQFSLDKEQLAFSVNRELGEEDIFIVYSKPDNNIVESLNKYDTVKELFNNLPIELANQI